MDSYSVLYLTYCNFLGGGNSLGICLIPLPCSLHTPVACSRCTSLVLLLFPVANQAFSYLRAFHMVTFGRSFVLCDYVVAPLPPTKPGARMLPGG